MNKGTKVRFVAGGRLRQISDKNVLLQTGMTEGVEIGEYKTGVVVHDLPQHKACVVEVEGKWYGWVYHYELYEDHT